MKKKLTSLSSHQERKQPKGLATDISQVQHPKTSFLDHLIEANHIAVKALMDTFTLRSKYD